MKLLVLIVLCICIVQICFATSTDFSEDMKNKVRNGIRNKISGASERFIEDVWIIAEKYQDNDVVYRMIVDELLGMLIDKIPRDENTSKIDANGIKKFNEKSLKNAEVVVGLEYLKILQSILSKQLPTERYMGVINLLYVVIYPNTTTKEAENALDYLYGPGNADLKDPLINIPSPNATDCQESYQHYSATIDRLKSMTDIKPMVLRNVATIVETFPCEKIYIQIFLENFEEIIQQLRAFRINESKISACLIKENPDKLKVWVYDTKPGGTSFDHMISSESIDHNIRNVESILSTRLTDETFRSIINFENAIIKKTSISDIQKALEYVFIDLPETNCSVKH